MSEIEKEFLKAKNQGFVKLSIAIGNNKEKSWFNLKYLAGKIVKIPNPQTKVDEKAIFYLFYDTANDVYYTLLTRSISLINSLVPVEPGDIFNIHGKREVVANRFSTKYSVEVLRKEELTTENLVQIKNFQKYVNEQFRKRIYTRKQQEDSA